ncbi:site-2 protease family protein [Paenibacillus spiritus]|uniref:Site-2 protease family protein n=1 Tax=Paenibacillus spiritus TaxID=2496557 RepID=A0A5J5GHN3_9BACL|nr:site-2 protease family protein [Paenibacillus spiritus]KAA9007665.1 site-2 protease family protein [Paenibacillus spiritus]
MDFLQRIIAMPLEQLPFFLVTIMIAFTVHEFAHAYFANKFGDPTARLLGRLTLNPASHIDFFGVLLIVIAGFGWARPIPVNRANFDRPRLMGIIVSVAGPVSNLLLAIVGAAVYMALIAAGVVDANSNVQLLRAFDTFFSIFVYMNLFLFFFNLIPLPPLDGYRVVEDLATGQVRGKLQQFEQWSIFIFLLIVFIPALSRAVILPLQIWAFDIREELFTFFGRLFGL